jgi:integrase
MKVTRAEINKLVRQVRDGKLPDLPDGKKFEEIFRSPKLPDGQFDEVFWHPAFYGFGVRLVYTGHASWIVQYKLHGRSQRQTIGDVRVLDEYKKDENGKEVGALAQAKNLLAKVQLHRFDPQAARAEARHTAKITFEAVAEQFLEMKKEGTAKRKPMRPDALAAYERFLTGYYFKPLHRLPFGDITHEQITLQIQRVKQRSGLATAHHCCTPVTTMFNWAIEKGMHPGPSPMLKVDVPQQGDSRDRVLNHDEIKAIWLACEAWEADTPSDRRIHGGLTNADRPRAIRLLFLTACRAQEIGELEWDEIDHRYNEFALTRPERTKNGKPLYLPLTDTALEILNRVERRPGKTHVFGTKLDQGTRLSNAREKIDKRIAAAGGVKPAGEDAGRPVPPFPPDWTIHDIRRTVRTEMGDIGIDSDIAERILNHVRGDKSNRAYDRSKYRKPMRDALVQWEAHLLSIVHGTEEKIVDAGVRRKSKLAEVK